MKLDTACFIKLLLFFFKSIDIKGDEIHPQGGMHFIDYKLEMRQDLDR